MKITIIAVGRAREGPETALVSEFQKRLPWPVELIEVEEKRPLSPQERMKSEGQKIIGQIPKGAFTIALDKAGSKVSSREFSAKLDTWAQASGSRLAFLIGGADGLDDQALQKADFKLSFGPNTWPHMLARVMLMEQLYRAWAIREGHPYHK